MFIRFDAFGEEELIQRRGNVAGGEAQAQESKGSRGDACSVTPWSAPLHVSPASLADARRTVIGAHIPWTRFRTNPSTLTS